MQKHSGFLLFTYSLFTFPQTRIQDFRKIIVNKHISILQNQHLTFIANPQYTLRAKLPQKVQHHLVLDFFVAADGFEEQNSLPESGVFLYRKPDFPLFGMQNVIITKIQSVFSSSASAKNSCGTLQLL